MLRITVEIVPFGDETQAREIGKGWIINDSTGANNISNYDCIFRDDRGWETSLKLKNFDRARGFWSLIGEALKGK